MAFCRTCGSVIPESALFCTGCGAGIVSETPSDSVTLTAPPSQISAAPEMLYYVANSMGQSMGPFNEEVVRSLIAQQRVTIKDSVRIDGASGWIPVTQSKFASLVAQQTGMNRLATSTCPTCGAGLVVQIKRSGFGLALIIIGFCLTPFFGIGIPIWVVGMVIRWGGKGKAFYRCARCNFSS